MKKSNWMMAVIVGATFAVASGGAHAQEQKAPAQAGAAKAGAPKAATQKKFASPEEAVQALVEAVRAANVAGMLEVIGPASKSWLFSGDKVADTADWKGFLEAYDKKHVIQKEGEDRAVLVCGDDWPFPAPLVKAGGMWSFDAKAGQEEIVNRRVGRNELDTIQTLLAIADAQREYAAGDLDRNGSNDYARRFISSPGKKDGLYWPVQAGEPQSPLGPLAAQAATEGYGKAGKAGKPSAYHGYFYRMLTRQGKDAPGGAYDYLVKGKLIGGFAALAYPAKYGVSGVMTFIVSHDGVVYQKDLGKNTPSAAVALKEFNPDKTWTKAQ